MEQEVCEGMVFEIGTVLGNIKSCIPKGALSPATVGMYILPYYVQELRIMYNTNDDNSCIYDRHAPIFENICGFAAIGKQISKKKEIVCIHGNLIFKDCNAIFKGVRDVSQIKGVMRQVLGEHHREEDFACYANMAVVTACLGKSSLVSTTGSLLETSLLFTQGSQCLALVAKTESEKNMVKFKIMDWGLLLKTGIEQVPTTSFVILDLLFVTYLHKVVAGIRGTILLALSTREASLQLLHRVKQRIRHHSLPLAQSLVGCLPTKRRRLGRQPSHAVHMEQLLDIFGMDLFKGFLVHHRHLRCQRHGATPRKSRSQIHSRLLG